MERFWFRVAVVGSALWLSVIAILSATMRDFAWSTYRDALGPAGVTAIVGVCAIFVLCLGVPWVMRAKEERH